MARRGVNLLALLRPHAPLLVVAFGAMLVQGLTELLEPWPLKVIFDYVLGGKPSPPWLEALAAGRRGADDGARRRRRPWSC